MKEYGTPRRTGLSGWWKAVPIVAAPFAVLFSETWFREQILNDQYRANSLRNEIRDAKAKLDALNDRRHELVRLERINAKAPDLGLVMPKPGQTIEVTAAPHPPASGPYILARRTKQNHTPAPRGPSEGEFEALAPLTLQPIEVDTE